MGDISKSIDETNQPSKAPIPIPQQQPKQNVVANKPQPPHGSSKHFQMLKQRQDEQAIIKAMKSSSMSPKTTPASGR